MPLYESTFIVRQDVANQQVEALAATLGQLVQDQGGTVVKTEQWGLKSLAYRVKKNRKGHYVMLGLDAPPAAVAELERNLRINEDVLRYMTVKVEELDANPSVMMQAKQGRDDRRRDDRYRDYEERYRPRGDRPAEEATPASQGGRE
jgi:small subunit ribosomal protein S6